MRDGAATDASCRGIMRLVWPIALGMANNAVMQFTDRVFLARDSEASLAAVLPAAMLSLLVVGFFQSLAAYSGTFAAQYSGAGERENARRAYGAGLAVALASGVFMLAAIPGGRLILEASGHSAEILAREKIYYSTTTAGGMATCLLAAASGYLTGCGRTRPVFYVNLAGNAANIVLDALLIFGIGPFPALGIGGAAIATVAAQVLQFAAVAAVAGRPLRPSRELVARVLRYGVPSGAYSVLNILSFTIFVFLTGRIGDAEFAVSNAAFTVNYLLIAPIEGFSVGAGTVVGRLQGARDSAGALRAGFKTLLLAETYIVAASALVLVFRVPILGMFVSPGSADAAAFMSLGPVLFTMMAAWQMFDAADVTLSGALKGAGDTGFVLGWMLLCAFLFWMPLLFAVYSLHPTMPALWSTQIAYVAVICAGTIWRWLRGPWRKIRLI